MGIRAGNESSRRLKFYNVEKAPTRTFTWLNVMCLLVLSPFHIEDTMHPEEGPSRTEVLAVIVKLRECSFSAML